MNALVLVLYAFIQHAEIVGNVVKCHSCKYFKIVMSQIANFAWSATLPTSARNR